MEEPDKEKADFFRNFGDASQFLPVSEKKACELFGYDRHLFREVQDEKTGLFDLSLSPAECRREPAGSFQYQCGICKLSYWRKIDLIDHYYRNKDTIFHEVL